MPDDIFFLAFSNASFDIDMADDGKSQPWGGLLEIRGVRAGEMGGFGGGRSERQTWGLGDGDTKIGRTGLSSAVGMRGREMG
jgi:hypothetical protein